MSSMTCWHFGDEEEEKRFIQVTREFLSIELTWILLGEPYLVRHKSTDLVRIGGLDLVRQQNLEKLYLVRQQRQNGKVPLFPIRPKSQTLIVLSPNKFSALAVLTPNFFPDFELSSNFFYWLYLQLEKPTDSVGLIFDNFVSPGHSPSNYISF